MPRLFDLLSDKSDKDALLNMQKKMREMHKPHHTSQQNKKCKPDTIKPKIQPPPASTQIKVPDFIALDVETTGLHVKTERIIEIGAVKFINNSIQETYSTLINPQKQISPLITDLTGISNNSIANAPLFESIVTPLLEFIGTYPICGHQIHFDISFINAELKRINHSQLTNSILDSAALSRLSLINLESYSLGAVAHHLNIPLENAHRALDDAKASGLIACTLIPRLTEIPESTRYLLGQIAPYSLLKTILLKFARPVPFAPQTNTSTGKTFYVKISPFPRQRHAIPKNVISQWIGNDQFLCSKTTDELKNHISHVLHTTANALFNKTPIFCEVPHDMQNLRPYLLPAALWALQNKCRVIISTFSKNLSEKVFNSDMQRVEKILHQPVNRTTLKHRSFYLCKLQWKRFLSGQLGSFSPQERLGVLPLVRWAEQTETGDIEEQNQFNRHWYSRTWQLVHADAFYCRKQKCPLYQNCFYYKALHRSLCAHIVFIHHSLFITDFCSNNPIFHHVGALIFEEAHALQQSFYKNARIEIDTNRMNRFNELLQNLLHTWEKHCQISSIEVQWFTHFKNQLKQVRLIANAFLSELFTVLSNGNLSPTKLLTSQLSPLVKIISIEQIPSCNAFIQILSELEDLLKRGEENCTLAKKNIPFSILDTVTYCRLQSQQLRTDLQLCLQQDSNSFPLWLEGDLSKRWVKLNNLPYSSVAVLGHYWKNHTDALLFFSTYASMEDAAQKTARSIGFSTDVLEKKTLNTIKNTHCRTAPLYCCSLFNEYEMSVSDFITHLNNFIEKLYSTSPGHIVLLLPDTSLTTIVYDNLKETHSLSKPVQFISVHSLNSVKAEQNPQHYYICCIPQHYFENHHGEPFFSPISYLVIPLLHSYSFSASCTAAFKNEFRENPLYDEAFEIRTRIHSIMDFMSQLENKSMTGIILDQKVFEATVCKDAQENNTIIACSDENDLMTKLMP